MTFKHPSNSNIKTPKANKVRKETNDVRTCLVPLCVDGKGHTFRQIRATKFGDSFLIKKTIDVIKKTKLMDGTEVDEVVHTKEEYWTRVFCGKCTLSALVLVKLMDEEA